MKWLARQTARNNFHDEYHRKRRENKGKRANLSKAKQSLLSKHEAEDYRVKAMLERRANRIAKLSKNCRDFRRYLKTLDRLYGDEDVCAVYAGVLNVDLGSLIADLGGVMSLNDSDRFLLVEETQKFVKRIERETFGRPGKRGYVQGDFGFDLPKGETYTLSDVKAALNIH